MVDGNCLCYSSCFGIILYSQGTLMLFSDTSDSSQKIFVEHTEAFLAI